MRKLYCYMILPLMALVSGCQHEEFMLAEQDVDVKEVYATIEDIDDGQTRTYLSGTDVFWSSGDQIAVFMANTLRKRFNVTPESIDSKDATFQYDSQYIITGKNDNISHNVAYYPFCGVTCSPDGSSYTLGNLTLPSTQSYVEGSVGLGAYPMVAVTENTDDVNFCFRNLCGVMQFQLKGYGFVKSVSVKGNRGEILAGPAVVTAGYGNDPSIAMSSEGGKIVTLDCGEGGVELNETTPVSFFIALPPVQFEGGFTITVTDTWGGSKEYSTSKKNPVGRSKGLRMPAKEYIGVRPPQEGDYIDEYGVNHGQGVEIDGIVWAPVNCGYHKDDFKYGKLYQWGRKYGQGYEGKLYVNGIESCSYSDAMVPIISQESIPMGTGQHSNSSSVFYISTGENNFDWAYPRSSMLWNGGTEDNPIKTEYDPCPTGWRVPTYAELDELRQHNSLWTTNESDQAGYWFSASNSYEVPKLFFSAAAYRYYNDGNAYNRGDIGNYWSSKPSRYSAYLLDIANNNISMRGEFRSNGCSVRCVQDNSDLVPVSSVNLTSTSLTLSIGATSTLIANISPSNANHKSAYWWSEDESIATVDSNGKITAVAEGTTTITAMAGMQTAECVVTVVAESVVDMSLSGTANSYIVSQKGAYKFKAVKGNSSESVGAVSSAEVLWETFGTDVTPNVGDLVKNVSYKDGEVTFYTTETFREGNAVIAAKDASGNILWSWHIWLTDEPQGQEYYNNAGTMMDRNLGAISATPGDVGAHGLMYQWGRKDPFLGPSSISGGSVAKSTITWPSAVSTSSSKGTVSYVTANPTVFIKASSSPYDWHYSSRNHSLWTTSDKAKSMYDPCPTGWRVPDGDNFGVWAKATGNTWGFNHTYNGTKEGMNFSGKFGSASTIWYPASGYLSHSSGDVEQVGIVGRYISASPFSRGSCSMVFDQWGYVTQLTIDRAEGNSVRCVQEYQVLVL